MPITIMRLLQAGIISILILGGCQQDAEAPLDTVAVDPAGPPDVTQLDVPIGQLSTDVTPLAYQLELIINPGQTFDPITDMVTGELNFPPELDANSWPGGRRNSSP